MLTAYQQKIMFRLMDNTKDPDLYLFIQSAYHILKRNYMPEAASNYWIEAIAQYMGILL